MTLKKDVSEIVLEESELVRKNNEIRQRLINIQKRIRNGDSTGDPIKDFVISSFGLSEVIERKFRLIKENLEQHKNEPVLVVKQEEHVGGCTGFGHSGFINQKDDCWLGIIAEPYIIFDLKSRKNPNLVFNMGGSFGITVPKFISVYKDNKKIQRGPIWLEGDSILYLNEQIHYRGMATFSGDYNDLKRGLVIVSGNEEVEKFFMLRGLYSLPEINNISPEVLKYVEEKIYPEGYKFYKELLDKLDYKTK